MNELHSLGSAVDWIVMICYFVGIMLFGSYFAKYNRNTTDFFFGGRRFAWWLISISIVATGVGSHSFVKYSAKGFEYGISSTMTYMNDWFFMPLFLFGWLPIVVYSRIRSIPEYFELRFSPSVRLIATIFQLLYMIGYLGIGLLTLGKVFTPLLPQSIEFIGLNINITLMGVIITIALITGIYTTFGGQTAVIFTDLIQGGILLITGVIIFALGISYVGGIDTFWNLLPVSWKQPLANFNSPPDFNFVGIFWQDGIAGSIGFLFMNMGLIMRFMSARSVNEGRKAAVFNVLFMLPISAIIVGSAGWIGKALLEMNPPQLNSDVNPDQVFIAVTHIIASKGLFGFVVAALTATLLSTVDSLINAIAAVYMNDIYAPLKKWLKTKAGSPQIQAKKELNAARVASILFTFAGVIATIPFNTYPTVYEAHGFFHSTLTPPLVTAIFLGVFWKKFTPAGVLTTFIGGSSLMIIGSRYPDILITPIAHGTPFDAVHPYSYISALYNLIVCVSLGIIITYSRKVFIHISEKLKSGTLGDKVTYILITIVVLSLVAIWFNLVEMYSSIYLAILITLFVSVIAEYKLKYDEKIHLEGLTVWSVKKAKERFKGKELNEEQGEKIFCNWIVRDDENDEVNISFNDMNKLKARVGDLIYISDKRKYLGGLKSFHSKIGEPHTNDGEIFISKDHLLSAQFSEDKIIYAEKEM
ncbi:MAG: sodium:solute symporter family protein [Melioribacteraceae bacterium]|nr:MAG: sodium:solute symporter family protein [Melioribacteraceae bacterium]